MHKIKVRVSSENGDPILVAETPHDVLTIQALIRIVIGDALIEMGQIHKDQSEINSGDLLSSVTVDFFTPRPGGGEICVKPSEELTKVFFDSVGNLNDLLVPLGMTVSAMEGVTFITIKVSYVETNDPEDNSEFPLDDPMEE